MSNASAGCIRHTRRADGRAQGSRLREDGVNGFNGHSQGSARGVHQMTIFEDRSHLISDIATFSQVQRGMDALRSWAETEVDGRGILTGACSPAGRKAPV